MCQVSREICNALDYNEDLVTAFGIKKVSEADRSADALVPVYLYVFVRANVPHIFSEMQFLRDFED